MGLAANCAHGVGIEANVNSFRKIPGEFYLDRLTFFPALGKVFLPKIGLLFLGHFASVAHCATMSREGFGDVDGAAGAESKSGI